MQSYTVDADYELVLSGINLRYDSQSRLSMASYSLDYYSTAGAYNEILTYEYAYDEASGDLSEMTVNGLTGVNGKILPIYDDFGRTTERTIRFNVDSEYAFYNKLTYTYQASASGLQTGLVSSVTSEVKQGVTSSTVISSSTLQYTYDDNGNITKITNNDDYSIQYSYDDLGQLIAESIDTPTLNVGYIYTYDSAGNIVSKKQYTTSGIEILSYTYSDSAWGDLLVYSPDGNDVGYDEIGNPIYIGYYAADEELWEYGYQLTWNGRQLEKIQNFEYYGDSVSDFTAYTYNADGIRTSKTVNGIKHEYILNGSQILAEKWTQNNVEYVLVYLYDETGSPIGIKYRTSNYAINTFDHFFFERNLQGDIVAIYNSTGEKIGTYAYTAFGEVVTTTVSGNTTLENNIVNNYNPFRYRGYYYDVETGWYYLQNRYYNPVWGRFINADGTVSTGQGLLGNNMFAYCYNNPVNGIDPCGTCFHHWKIWEDCEQCRRKTSTNITGDVGAWFEKRRAEASIWWDQKVKEVTALFNKSKQTVEDITEIIMSNAYLDAGICFGANIASSYGSFFAYDFGFRMDIIGAQLKDGSFRIGHVGRSAYTIQIFGVVIGPQNNTFETFEGDRYVEETVYFDYTPKSIGSAASFPVGYHWNAYVSVWGIVTDLYDYFSK